MPYFIGTGLYTISHIFAKGKNSVMPFPSLILLAMLRRASAYASANLHLTHMFSSILRTRQYCLSLSQVVKRA